MAGLVQGAGIEGKAHFLVDVGESLTSEEKARRWFWVSPREEQKFDDLVRTDRVAYARLRKKIQDACRGNLIGRFDVRDVRFPLGGGLGMKPGSVIVWIAEWKEPSAAGSAGCYRIYFTDVAMYDAAPVRAPMAGLLFRSYPRGTPKQKAQDRDIRSALSLARSGLEQRGVTVRRTVL